MLAFTESRDSYIPGCSGWKDSCSEAVSEELHNLLTTEAVNKLSHVSIAAVTCEPRCKCQEPPRQNDLCGHQTLSHASGKREIKLPVSKRGHTSMISAI